MVALYTALVVCAVLAAMLVDRYDMHDREPWPMLLLAAAMGAGAMWAVGHAETLTISLLPEPRPDALIAVVAGTHEELARLLVVALLALLAPRRFNDPMDGIIYGSIVGLGMALEESVYYLGLWGERGPMLPASEPVRLCGHLVMGGITAFAVGMARLGMARWKRALLVCLAFSVAMHSAWDWIAFTAGAAGRMHPWQTAAAIGLMVGGMLFYGALVVVAADWSRRLFAPHRAAALWGWPLTLLARKGPG